MVRISGILGAICLLLASLATPVAARSIASNHQAAAGYKVGEVLDVGGVNDKSFNHLAYLGLARAERQYKVNGQYIVSTGEADYVPNLTYFATHGYKMVVGVGFLMQSAMYQVASQYPNVKFGMVDGCPTPTIGGNCRNLPNVANLFFKEQESGYLVGVIAGLMEMRHIGAAKHMTVGAMGGVSIPPVNRYIAGYFAGVHKVCPACKVKLGYSQSFTDQGKGKEIGLSQIGQGADILFQVAGSSGLGYLAAAQQKGKYGIGVDADQGYLGKFVITSALKKVDNAVFLTIGSALKKKFKGGDHKFSLLNNSTGFAPVSSVVPASIVAQANRYEGLIKTGKIVPPQNIP